MPCRPICRPAFEDLTLCVGEGFAGPPFSEVAHIDLLLGWKDGPVGQATGTGHGTSHGPGTSWSSSTSGR